jgi:hypothetical protein
MRPRDLIGYPVVSRALNGDTDAMDYLRVYDPRETDGPTLEDVQEMTRKGDRAGLNAILEEWRALRREIRGESTP